MWTKSRVPRSAGEGVEPKRTELDDPTGGISVRIISQPRKLQESLKKPPNPAGSHPAAAGAGAGVLAMAGAAEPFCCARERSEEPFLPRQLLPQLLLGCDV